MLTSIPEDIAFELAIGISLDGSDDYPDYPLAFNFINDEIVDRGRWSIYHTIVFEYDGQLYGFNYDEPATEYQEDQDRFDDNPVPVWPMKAEQITTTIYRKAT